MGTLYIHMAGLEDDLRLGNMHQQMVEGLEFSRSSMCACAVPFNVIGFTHTSPHTSENTEPHMLQCTWAVARNIKEVIICGLMCCVEVHTLTYLHFQLWVRSQWRGCHAVELVVDALLGVAGVTSALAPLSSSIATFPFKVATSPFKVATLEVHTFTYLNLRSSYFHFIHNFIMIQ